MKAGVLFSGGKDSSLAAILLSTWYEVELNTFLFSHNAGISDVKAAAASLGYKHHIRSFPEGFLAEITDMIVKDGFPNNAIQQVHREAIRHLCGVYDVVADGTRFGDRVPLLSDDEIRSISDRFGCSYVRPLIGFPKREVERLVSRYLTVEYGETGNISNGDYETGIRKELKRRGLSPEQYFPPAHQQSLITGRLILT
ncbi:alpha hydrolase [Methanospirillum stamsii]|uniref:Alpha hydrolase n=1 Tax=Methanospirillum stamsii TaxID=1277351 RepID=A0A2V2N804_9EURY|nr:alpha hydrolase [Methanospirillum stamsii]PWR76114.1 alpha hydrolase [Methanospirillum stamsii]